MNLHLIDTHCHLDTLTQAPVEELVQRAGDVGVKQMICIGAGNGRNSPERAVELTKKFPNVYASIGIHPQEAGKFEDLDRLRPLAEDPKVLAIGETGLDFYRDWGAPEENQVRVFLASIRLAKDLKKPLIIHCRDVAGSSKAQDMILESLKKENAKEVGGVFHCYPYDADFAKELAQINFLVSFPGTLTFKSANGLREAAKEIPLEQMMVETDAPYMAPEPFRGKPSEPAHVRQIAEKLAEVKSLSIEKIAEATTANARRLFRIPEVD